MTRGGDAASVRCCLQRAGRAAFAYLNSSGATSCRWWRHTVHSCRPSTSMNVCVMPALLSASSNVAIAGTGQRVVLADADPEQLELLVEQPTDRFEARRSRLLGVAAGRGAHHHDVAEQLGPAERDVDASGRRPSTGRRWRDRRPSSRPCRSRSTIGITSSSRSRRERRQPALAVARIIA